MVRRLGLGKNNHLTCSSLALNPRYNPVTHSIFAQKYICRVVSGSASTKQDELLPTSYILVIKFQCLMQIPMI